MGSYMWKMRLLRLQEDVEGVVAVEACDDDEEVAVVADGVVGDDEDDGFDVEQLEEVDGSIEPGHEDGKEWSL